MVGHKIVIIFIFLAISSTIIMLGPGSPIYSPLNSFIWYFFIAGFGTGTFGVALAVSITVICRRIHRTNFNKNGYKIHISESIDRLAEVAIQTNNIYTENNEMSGVPYTAAPGECRAGPHMSQQYRLSTSTDYTESHYYTEIDEYFINKRNEKLETKLQKRNERSALHANTPGQAASSQLESSTLEYDYAYGRTPLM